MIIAKKKPIEEIIGEVENFDRILILGCNECVTVCEAGGKKEVEILASALRMNFMAKGKEKVIDERTLERQCDHEYLEEICPVSRCAKRVMNGPCGGSTNGKCEISKDVDCAWQLIIDRLKALNKMEDYEKVAPIKDWSTDRAGGPRTVTREDVKI